MKKAETDMKKLNTTLLLLWIPFFPIYSFFSIISGMLSPADPSPLLAPSISMMARSPIVAIICIVFSITNHIKKEYKKAAYFHLIPIIYSVILFCIIVVILEF